MRLAVLPHPPTSVFGLSYAFILRVSNAWRFSDWHQVVSINIGHSNKSAEEFKASLLESVRAQEGCPSRYLHVLFPGWSLEHVQA